ncbi:nitric oxide-sensing protein NosP [Nitrincola tapanii]|uniref:GfdT protein n=1 Tax=Nitrincola tapanii TaxID=1708751 RepID=A0A5A9W6I3_9GAMM|nr:nitric oxide-sensing protein NosP [Nitrincola tapanii]KAA0876397.1 GfdT protein [Nitrincola tapanii]
MNAPLTLDPVRTAYSRSSDAQVAAQELAQQLITPDLGFVLFFCSAEYDLSVLQQALNQAFGEIPLAGCTTAGEITPQGYDRGSLCAIGFHRQYFSVEIGLVEELAGFGLKEAQKLVDELIVRGRSRHIAPLKGHLFAMTLLDGLSSQEELVLVALDSALGSIPHFGGSAGDDIQLARTHVFAQGQFRTEAAVMILVNTPLDFEVFSTHHLRPQAEKLVVTAADAATRTVHELNAEPAGEVYARLVGVPPEALNPEVFALHPIGVKVGQEYYVRSIQRMNEDLSLTFYCAVGNGIVLTPLQSQPIMPDLAQRFQDTEQRIGPPLLTIGCDCFLRRLEIEHLDQAQEASRFLMQHQVVGFNTYGEHYDGVHINQTFTGVVIGRSR